MTLTDTQIDNLRELALRAIGHIEAIPQETDGLTICLSGGGNRDALIPGEKENDLDFLVLGADEAELRDRGFHDVNASNFGVFIDRTRAEWALARTETKPEEKFGYKGIETDTDNVSLKKDLSRRDLTMNAMALQLAGDEPAPQSDIDPENIIEIPDADGDTLAYFIDPFGGRKDIKNGVIKHVTEAFTEDPIRILRTARYYARFNLPADWVDRDFSEIPDGEHVPFTVAKETRKLLRRIASDLNLMSKGRMGLEISKAMEQAASPIRFWDLLQDVGALAVIAPRLDRAQIVPAGPEKYHLEGDTYTHTMFVLQQMHSICEEHGITGVDRSRRLMMAVSHDLGKVTLANKQGGLWSDDPPRRFGGHAETGVQGAEDLATNLGLDDHMMEAMKDAAQLHMDAFDLLVWNPERVLTFVDDHTVPEGAKKPFFASVQEIIDLIQADHQGRWQEVAVFDDSEQFDAEMGPEGAAQPLFNREEYINLAERANDALSMYSGFTVMQEGLCPEHDTDDISESELAATLNQCSDCKSPGEWVGDRLLSIRKAELE